VDTIFVVHYKPGMTHFIDLPLRPRKRALTRKRLCDALVSHLATRPIEDVSVAELCADAGVSQGTFFNYFPAKGDLLTHFIRLWSLRVAVVARQAEASHASALSAIEAIFASTAADSLQAPNLMLEIIAHQARMPAELSLEPIEEAERLLLLPDEPDPMSLPDTGLGGLLPPLITKAVRAGELPPHTDVQLLTLTLAGVFFGAPLVLGRTAPEAIGPMWQQQLRLVWAGARGVSP
jgi:AcrR family transcriptional regulator